MNKIGIIGGKLGGYIWGADSTPLSHHVLALRASSSQLEVEILFLRNKIEKGIKAVYFRPQHQIGLKL